MKTTNSISASARRSSWLRRLTRIALILMACVALLAIAGWGWLQSAPGRRWVLQTVTAQLDGLGGQRFTLDGLEGTLPTRI